ncbi:MAG TPA: response regulator [Bacteroidia bacterium]|nr:response regulator [Bacteroidia bacterium]
MSKRKLFIIEDDPMFAEMLQDYLKSRPMWEVKHFMTGEDALTNAYLDPELVIIDYHLDSVNLKGLSGIETMMKLKKISPKSHCVFLSGQKSYGVALQTISHGAENYIIKDKAAFDEIGKILDGLPVT